MILGTAGFSAALSVQRLEENGLNLSQGPVLVAGATGGVGNIAVNILAKRGYDVVASTGKSHEADYLRELGATQIIDREEVMDKYNYTNTKTLASLIGVLIIIASFLFALLFLIGTQLASGNNTSA